MSSMTEGTTPSAKDGSGGGLIAFLNWTIDKDELVDATASALRTGCVKVLSVEDDWQDLDLRTANLDNIVSRFRTRHRLDMKERTLDQYEARLRQSVEMYLKWLDGDATWKPSQRKKAAASNGGNGGGKKAAPAAVRVPAALHPEVPVQPDPPKAGMITYPFPIRPGLRGSIQLPEDLTEREAKRIGAFIATLALEDEPEPVVPLAIESRKEPDPWASGE